jgi:hypothetical protein
LVLSGKLLIHNPGEDDADIDSPEMMITTKPRQHVRSTVSCRELTVSASGALTCTFTARFNSSRPTAGTVRATVTIPGPDGSPARKARSKQASFDFTKAQHVTVGERAKVSNWWKQGQGQGGYIQPDNVAGQQPDRMLIGDSRTFNLVGYFSTQSIDISNCGTTLKVNLQAGTAVACFIAIAACLLVRP